MVQRLVTKRTNSNATMGLAWMNDGSATGTQTVQTDRMRTTVAQRTLFIATTAPAFEANIFATREEIALTGKTSLHPAVKLGSLCAKAESASAPKKCATAIASALTKMTNTANVAVKTAEVTCTP